VSTTRLLVDPAAPLAPVGRRLFGSFLEHLGRAVYTGVYEPGHPAADERGFRRDVLELVRELGVTVVRYPGGNFVSGYDWEDGVGPVDERPVRLDAAWHSIETNRFGLHEFVDWTREAGVEVMEAVNMGTRGIDSARRLLEYANFPAGTTLSDRRRANGAEQPFGIRLWCLGNEVDGEHQIGHKTAEEYGRLAAETARLMRWIDPGVELVVAGSSNAEMDTFGEWERTVLRHSAEHVDHISLHAYYEETDGDVPSFLASAVRLDRHIEDVAAAIDDTLGELGLDKRIGISVDEWNVWRQSEFNDGKAELFAGPWVEHPRLIENEYTVTDAVVVATLMHSLLRHADRVSVANLAQLVNVIAPIRTEPGGPAWRQTTFFPFAEIARLATGEVVPVAVDAPAVPTAALGAVAQVDAVSVVDPSGGIALFVANRGLSSEAELDITISAPGLSLDSARLLAAPEGGTRDTSNTQASQPVGLVPLDGVTIRHVDDGSTRVGLALPPVSWAALRLAPAAEDSRA